MTTRVPLRRYLPAARRHWATAALGVCNLAAGVVAEACKGVWTATSLALGVVACFAWVVAFGAAILAATAVPPARLFVMWLALRQHMLVNNTTLVRHGGRPSWSEYRKMADFSEDPEAKP